MQMLYDILKTTPDFIIDQGKALEKSIKEIFAESYIKFCAKHLSRKKYMQSIFRLNKLPNKEEYDKELQAILDDITVPEKREKVRRLYCSTSRFYSNTITLGHSTNNAAESFNSYFSFYLVLSCNSSF